jgi:hypothetical protein
MSRNPTYEDLARYCQAQLLVITGFFNNFLKWGWFGCRGDQDHTYF